MWSDQEVKDRREKALALLLEVEAHLAHGPIALYLYEFTTALEDQIDFLTHPPVHGHFYHHGETLHQSSPQ